MKWSYIFNPFEKFSELKLVLIGIIGVFIGALVAIYANVSYDGVLDLHQQYDEVLTSYILPLRQNVIIILIVFVLFYILGKILNKRTKVIDILNIALIYRIPFYFGALLTGLIVSSDTNSKIIAALKSGKQLNPEEVFNASFLVLGILLFFLLVYSIVLLVNGFRVAVNIKKTSAYIYFSITLLLAELLSKYLVL